MNKPTRWIIDDFLPEDELKEIEQLLLSQQFPWFAMDGIVYEGDPDKRMVHMLYKENVTDEYFGNFIPIYRELRAEYILKAKINLDLRADKTYTYHVDADLFEKYNPLLYTGIFNFTDCNGGTKFKKDSKFIKSKRNRMVIFSSCYEHAGVCPTDSYFRYGLNINWLGDKPVRGTSF
ncbi:hypothetical protein [uncultured phage MedDCM-OCT-S05-C139]|nr:hypothetical protein [uncultured phage MedDCM-OCT-S05-C139]